MENIKKQNSSNKTVKTKKKMSKGGIVLLISSLIILVPCLIFGGILLKSALETGKPVVGSRFDNDLEPAITSSNTSSLTTTIKAISGVEDCEIVLTSAQYRVNVNAQDSLSSSEIEALAKKVYDAVNNELPVSTYFTATDSKKMYDLSINVYNYVKEDDDNMIYYILTKNSKMSDYSIQCVSEPVDEELAKDLRGENVTTTDDPVATEDSESSD